MPEDLSVYDGIVSSHVAEVYLNEAHYCYLHGNFFAAVIMMASAFESCLKSIVCDKSIAGLPSNNSKNIENKSMRNKNRAQRIRKLDQDLRQAEFKDLIREAWGIKIINDEDKKELCGLREIRNQLMHNYDRSPFTPKSEIPKTDLRYVGYDEISNMAKQAVQLTPLFVEIQRVRGVQERMRPKDPYYI